MKLLLKLFPVMVAGMLMFGVAACDEQEEKARERGNIPKKTVDDAQKKIDAAVSKMTDRTTQQDQTAE